MNQVYRSFVLIANFALFRKPAVFLSFLRFFWLILRFFKGVESTIFNEVINLFYNLTWFFGTRIHSLLKDHFFFKIPKNEFFKNFIIH